MSTTWIEQPDHQAWLLRQTALQLNFARNFAHPEGGSWWLDDRGSPDHSKPVHTYVTARMLHAYSLGHLAGIPGCAPLAARALAGLTGPLHDAVNGGWFASTGPGQERNDAKVAYAHAFVVLATSSATIADIPHARDVLDEALEVLDARFWEAAPGLHRDQASADWSSYSDYRGVNANMHSVEALLAASDATGDPQWRERAARVTTTVLGWAQHNDWRIPEHFDATWAPMMEHHRDEPDHPFEPYGATVGHGLEWSRLALHVAASGAGNAPTLAEGSADLFDRAVADGWAADGAEGFVYTTDWAGAPMVRQRMHWVVAEAICAAAALHQHTGDHAYDEWYRTWWDYAATYLIDDNGSWRHELDPRNQPSATVWSGRPDLYHSLHATLLPRLPLSPTAPAALAQR